MEQWITTSEAAARLGVKRGTLYSYVSRGVLTSRRMPGQNESLFDRTQIDSLAAAKHDGRRSGDRLLRFRAVASGVSAIRDDRLYLRGRDIEELCADMDFADVAQLVLDSSEARPVPDVDTTVVHGVSIERRIPLTVALVAAADPLRADLSDVGARVLGLLPHLAAAVPEIDFAHRWVDLLATVLIDNGLAASTTAARVAASARAGIFDALLAGYAALAGPLHGGAPATARALLDAVVGGAAVDRALADAVVGGLVPGFGHVIYSGPDPRAQIVLDRVRAERPRSSALAAAEAVEQRVGRPMNIDFAGAVVTHELGLPARSGEVLFVGSRRAFREPPPAASSLCGGGVRRGPAALARQSDGLSCSAAAVRTLSSRRSPRTTTRHLIGGASGAFTVGPRSRAQAAHSVCWVRADDDKSGRTVLPAAEREDVIEPGMRSPFRFDQHRVHRAVGAVVGLLGAAAGDDAGDDAGSLRTAPELDGALVAVIDPVDADDLAQALIREFASPPSSERLTAFIAAIPAAPRVRWPEPRTSAPRFDVRQVADVEALAHWLNLDLGELEWFAARGRWSRRTAEPLRHYRVKRIVKRDGGFRIIEAPKERLATVQRKVLDEILVHVPPHPSAHGFMRGRSVESFGSRHALHDVVVRVDLRRCFEHVTYPRVKAVFSAIGYAPAVASYLACLCTTSRAIEDRHRVDFDHAVLLRERHLPQGAPTSPALLNLVLRRLDYRVAGYAARHGVTYTRYGDDLAFSGDDVDVGGLLWFIERVVKAEGFAVHRDKVRVMRDHQRQQLGGLVVNRGPRSCRSDYDALKALLHNAIRDGAESQNRDDRPDFRSYVYGRIGWVSTGSARRGEKLRTMAAQVDWHR
ncbi:citrate/2-methylcitrate synthase [Gordonia neofelifaecis]|uniref:citrate synthase (unknown stereospecificity) n=1 Tax=Gordonia neofelifaecis NRRL B-59395 TaxID=644548 RepID=F1YFV4_9ACTN|nr:citrate/2-methylcitrate synthase [Gordonia neofelifaecis]EGD56531.1 DNA binding domain protein, excisionase family [Gordonia neofelifaecis NRRL B-59395]